MALRGEHRHYLVSLASGEPSYLSVGLYLWFMSVLGALGRGQEEEKRLSAARLTEAAVCFLAVFGPAVDTPALRAYALCDVFRTLPPNCPMSLRSVCCRFLCRGTASCFPQCLTSILSAAPIPAHRICGDFRKLDLLLGWG